VNLIEITRPGYPSYQIDLDQNENIYLGGSFRDTIRIEQSTEQASSHGTSDLFAAKYDLNGNLMWLKTIEDEAGNVFHRLTGLKVFEEDQLVLGGRIVRSSTYFGDHLIHSSGSNGFLALLGDKGVGSLPASIKSNIHIYPNPAKDYLKVTGHETSEYTIYSINGSIMLQGIIKSGENLIHMKGMEKGIYIISVKGKKTHHMEKILLL
jgi:hypothetical protein